MHALSPTAPPARSCLHVLPEVHVLERVSGVRHAVSEPLSETEDVHPDRAGEELGDGRRCGGEQWVQRSAAASIPNVVR